MTLTAARVFLLAHDPVTGRCTLSARRLKRALAHAILCDLAAYHKVALGDKVQVRALPEQERGTGSALLDSALSRIQRTAHPQSVQWWVQELGTGALKMVSEQARLQGQYRRQTRWLTWPRSRPQGQLLNQTARAAIIYTLLTPVQRAATLPTDWAEPGGRATLAAALLRANLIDVIAARKEDTWGYRHQLKELAQPWVDAQTKPSLQISQPPVSH